MGNEMPITSILKPIFLGLACSVMLATPGTAQAPVSALDALQTGQWELRNTGNSGRGQTRSICLRNAGQFVQLRHGGADCPQRVLRATARAITVRYECAGTGWGQSTISVETPRLAQIDTQGIDRGSPFHNSYEARWTGNCG
jgi:hypothetical protein